MILPGDPIAAVAAFDPVDASPMHTLRDLAARMSEAGVGALVVKRSHGRRAIVTERDIVTALAAGGDPDGEWTTDVMTRDVIEVAPEEPISEVTRLMVEAGVRHVVIVDATNDRLGIVSIRDIVEPLLEATARSLS